MPLTEEALEYIHVNTETRSKAQPVPKLKPATINAKIKALNTELSELQGQHQQLIDSASDSPLIGQYIATKKSGGTAFSGKSEKQAVHDYYALVNTTGAFIRYVGKHEAAAYRDRIQLGKKVAKLNRAIARCTKRLNDYRSKLPLAEQTEALAAAASASPPDPQEDVKDESEVGAPEGKLYTVKSAASIVSEAA